MHTTCLPGRCSTLGQPHARTRPAYLVATRPSPPAARGPLSSLPPRRPSCRPFLPPRPAVGLGPPSPSRAPLYPLQQRNRWGCISTKLNQRGLASIDRNNKTTLLFTAPSDITKSYAKVLFPRMVNCKTSASTRDFPLEYRYRPAKIQGPRGLFVSDYDVWETIAAFWHGF